jgi:hypothetical protein
MTADHLVTIITTALTAGASLGVAYLGYLGVRVRQRGHDAAATADNPTDDGSSPRATGDLRPPARRPRTGQSLRRL